MACTTIRTLSQQQKAAQEAALARLERGLALGNQSVTIGANGAIAFPNWQDNADISDVCAYRALSAKGSAALRRAVMRAESLSGRKLNPQAIAAGVHSHDGGKTWAAH